MDDAALIYLEADDEVTSVVRRVRASTDPRVVVVAPGRSRATSSVVALRLLARFGAEENREIAIVGDALTRSLAGEAGLAAYLTVDDARRAAPVDPTASAPRRAGIHVVRGTDAQDAAPTMPAAPLPVPDAAWAETRPTPVTRLAPAASRAARRGGARRRAPLAVAAAALAALLVASVVAGAVLLPGASVSIVPRVVTIPPTTYMIEVDGAEHVAGTVEDVATVTATGTYPILQQATGTVTLFNYNVAAQDVPDGTLVAAADQAFETVTPVVVPEGSLTPSGTIQAGEASVQVMASAPGPAGNVPSSAINTVLSEGPRNRLRGFANNEARLVTNPGPTAGGSVSNGREIMQEDVDAAVASLRSALDAAVARELDRGDVIAVPVGALSEPVLEGLDGLVGTRDQPEVEIRGTLGYDQWLVDREDLESAAAERLAGDEAAISPGHRVIDGEASVQITETAATAGGVQVTVQVSGRAEAVVDERAVVERIRGLALDDARAELEDLGRATIDLWPGWVTSVTEVEWRIEVLIEGANDTASPQPATSASP